MYDEDSAPLHRKFTSQLRSRTKYFQNQKLKQGTNPIFMSRRTRNQNC